MKISHKINFYLFFVVLVSVAIIGAVFYAISRQAIMERISAHLSTTTQSRAGHIKAFLKEDGMRLKIIAEIDELELVAQKISRNDLDRQQFIIRANNILKDILNAEDKAYMMFMLNTDGKVVASSDGKGIGIDRSDDSYFLGGRTGVYIKTPYFFESVEKFGYTVSVPITNDETNDVLGVLVARFLISGVNDIISDMTGLGETGETYIVSKYGFMITPSRFLQGDDYFKQEIYTLNIRRAFGAHEMCRNASENIEDHLDVPFVFKNYRGVWVLGTHADILNGWVLFVEIEISEAFAPLAKMRFIFLISILILVIMIYFLHLHISKNITVPIEVLKEGALMIGRGNFDHRVDIHTGDELEALAGAFNKIGEDLKKTTTSIEVLNEEMDKRQETDAALKRSNKELEYNDLALKNILYDSNKTNEKLREKGVQLLRNEKALKNMLYDLGNSNRKLKETQNQFLQSEKMAATGQLSAGVAHEIKNPLATILMSIESIDPVIKNLDEKTQRRIQMIVDAAERANKIVNEMLAFSRQTDFNMGEVNLNNILKGVVVLLKNVDKVRNITIVEEFAEDDVLLEGDHIFLEQVFFNLCTNAVDAMDRGGTLGIKMFWAQEQTRGESRREIVVEISDTGVGISEEHLKNIFNPFFTTKEPGKGTGLGLSTVHMIIDRHNGGIEVESAVGEGTKFIVTLPALNAIDNV